MVGLCAAHHLHGVHRGWVRVRGQAPEGLTWELGYARVRNARKSCCTGAASFLPAVLTCTVSVQKV